jgi:diacylglycerol kinase (ATP)
MKRTFSVAARLPSFLYAGRGVKTLLASQHDAWIHGAATVLVVAGGIAAKLTRFEWLALGYFMA